ncbi:efflux RND transporter permease subunit [Candidatus Sumerlaeota bacterium]|nr:efflux RND transporter permease subunit [Candidatus Sumerlaeota bacterium]
MKLTALAVNRPITTLMVFLIIIALGGVAYQRLPVQLLPDITLPRIGIYAQSDKSTEDNLEEITKKVEAIAADMRGVKQIRSNTRSGSVWITAEFEFGTDIQYAVADLNERLASFRTTLSDRRVNINAFPFSTDDFQATYMWLAVRGDGDPQALFKAVGDKIETSLKAINGVSNVAVQGITGEAVEVNLKPDLLAAYKLDMNSVITKVQAATSDNTFLGRLNVPGETHFVRLGDRVKTAGELANIEVDGKGLVRLKDVSEIVAGKSSQSVSRANGKSVISIGMEREAGRNLIELAHATRARVAEISQTLPPGMELVIDEDMAMYVERAIDQVKHLALTGALLALIVPLIFFRSLRVALIIFLSVPICLISVFNLFLAMGMSINIFSIVGLALGVGMLVDNSIVVVENTIRLYNAGASPLEAGVRGGSEVGRGLLASTLTSTVVFIPLAFLDGEFKLVVKEPTLAMVFPLLLSLLVALTLVPVFTYFVLKTRKRKVERRVRLPLPLRIYSRLLKSALRHRARVIFLVVAAVAFTWLESCNRIRQTSYSQRANSDFVGLYFQVPRGSKLAEVDAIASAIEDRLAKRKNVRTFYVSFNNEGGNINLRLLPRAEREDHESTIEIERTLVDFIGPIPGAEISHYRFDQPIAEQQINLGQQGMLELKGLEPTSVNAYAERLIDALRTHPMITNARLQDERENPVYLALMNRDKARLFGVNSRTLGQYVGATRSSGTISSLQLVDGDKRTDVAFTVTEAEGETLESVKDMSVFSPGFGVVPLGDLAQFQISQTQGQIRRVDRQSSVTMLYYYKKDANPTTLKDDIKKMIAALPNPGGVVAEFTGDEQRVDKRASQFLFLVVAGMVLVYVVMASVFESYWVPFVIIATNPLMIIGIVWALDWTKLPMDDLAAFGMILLIGLAVNNGIVMMDRTLSLQRSGVSRTRAVFDASITRLRPIIMTYLTTLVGLLPMAMSGDEADQWRPVAVVIIGGLSSATILTVFVLPCFYLIGDDFVRWARAPFLSFLKVVFEVLEGLSNLVLHPVLLLKRRIPFMPNLWPFLASVLFITVEIVRTPLRLLWKLPADAVYALLVIVRGKGWVAKTKQPRRSMMMRVRDLWRRMRGTHFTEGVPEIPGASEQCDVRTIALRNVQVIFPPTGLRALHARLPERFRGGRRFEDFGVHALDGIALNMQRGLFGLLGPNGAGKTTLLRCIAGLLEPTRGVVRIFGISHREAPHQLAPLIGYLPQTHGHYEWMTLYNYLMYFATHTALTVQKAQSVEPKGSLLRTRLEALTALANPQSRHQAVMAAVQEVNLTASLHQKVGSFSGGMKQRAGIARILLQSPPVLIVDEPTAGLDPVERMNVRLLLARLAEKRLVIFSTHIVEDLEQSCEEIAILDKGRLIYHGSPLALRESWNGRIWDVMADMEESDEALRARVEKAQTRVLYEIVRNQRNGVRVFSPRMEGRSSTSPDTIPTLEESLLATLRTRAEERVAKHAPPA